MGILKRQSIQSTIIIYLGFLLGAVNTLFLFPKYLTPEQFGLTRILFDFSSVFVQLAILGVPAVMFKFYPFYKDHLDKRENDTLFISLLIGTIGFIFYALLVYVFREEVTDKFIKTSPLFVDFFYIVYLFSFFILIYSIIETYARNNLESVIGNFVREIGFRFYATILILLFAWRVIDFTSFVNIYSIFHLWGIIMVIIFLVWRKKIHFNFSISKVTRRLYKKMMSYGSFIYGAGVLFILASNVDAILIAGIKGLESTAIFVIATYLATIIQVPQRSMAGIVIPILAKAWKDKDIGRIERIYKKTAINQMATSLLLFLIIWCNIDSVFELMPNGEQYQAGKYIVLFMCFAKIIDMSTGANSEILATSNFWKFNFITQVILVTIAIPSNYFLIKKFGIIGSAYSNLLAFSIYNLVRFIFLWWKFNLQPFSYKTLACLAIAIITYLAVYFLPVIDNIYLKIIIRTLTTSIIFLLLIFALNISEDINLFIRQLFDRMKHKLS